MASEWRRVRLGDLVSIKHGWPFKSECYSEERKGRPIVVSVGNFRYTGGFRFSETAIKEYADQYPSEYELRPGEILLVMTCQTAGGEILGIPARVPDDGNIYLHNQRLGRVVIKDSRQVCDDYLYWLFLWSEFNRELVASASGTKILHTAPGRIEAFSFSLPSISEQRAIAAVLDALDDRIELNRRMNVTLERMTQALFKSWFVDFDPVKAKAAGRAPEGMDAETATLFPGEFQDTEMGLIPKGWELRNFGSLLNLTIGGDWGAEQLDEKNQVRVAVIRGTDIPTLRDGRCETIPYRYVQPNKFQKRKLQDGDIVIEVSGGSRDQATGRSIYLTDSIFSRLEEAAIPASFCRLFRGRGAEVSLLLAVHLRSLYDAGGTWEYQNQSTGISNFQTEHFLTTEQVVFPDEQVCKKFFEFVRPIVERQQSSEILTLSRLRDTLLPKLISGQLRIPDIEQAEGGV